MKKLLAILLLAVGVGLSVAAVRDYRWANNDEPLVINHASVLQAKTSHEIVFLNSSGEDVRRCTGTAIGPHVFITAAHCDSELPSVRMDYGKQHYKILSSTKDATDHIIYLIDGPAFFYVDPYKTRAPKLGERVYIYGFGNGAYPADLKTGVVLNEYDPSEVNYREGLFYASIKVMPGDSGAAIYGLDGEIVGLVSYKLVDQGVFFDRHSSANFKVDSSKLNTSMLKPTVPAPIDIKNAFELFGFNHK